MAEPPEKPAEWGWTFDDAHVQCELHHGRMYQYECFEDPKETLLVAAVCLTNDVNKVTLGHMGKRLVTTTLSGKPCSGRVGKYLNRVDSSNYQH